MKGKESALKVLLLAGTVSLAAPGGAWAQNNGPGITNGIETVTVTAQKREENVQTVPLSVTPLTGATLERLHMQDLKDITGTVPNVQVQVNGGLSLAASYVVRGIGIAANPSPYVGTEVGTVIDGVVQSVNELGLVDQFDVERIEVLRGPQGTLFGANTTGGVINIITRQPTGVYGAYGTVSVGNFGQLDGSGAVNFPIIEDELAGKLSFSHRGRDGFYTNLYTGERIGGIDSNQARAYLRWTPTANLDVTWQGEMRRIRNGTDVLLDIAYPGEIFYRPDTPLDFKLYSDVPDIHNTDTFSNTITANWRTGLGTFTSITNYSTWKSYGFQDVDGIDCQCYEQVGLDKGWQASQELRDVFHPLDNVEVLIGGFAQFWGYNSNGQGWPQFASPNIVSVNLANQRTTNLAAFSQVYWKVTDRLRVQAGLRVSWERVKMKEAALTYFQPAGTDAFKGFGNLVGAALLPSDPNNLPAEGAKDWTNVGGKFGVDYQVTDEAMVYGYYARGFKSGGFNGRVTAAADIGPYNPEFVNSYEIGAKTNWLDNHLQLNMAAFLNKWSNMQVNQVLYRGTPPQASSTILNAAQATTEGIELEGEFIPVDGLRLNATVGYLHAVYDDFLSGSGALCPPAPATQPSGCAVDYSGRDLVYSPKWNASFSATYSFPVLGGVSDATVQYTFNGKRWGNYTQAPSELLPAVSLVNANLSWTPEDGKWTVALWARNLFDRKYLSLALDAPPLFTEGLLGAPRQVGVDFSFNF
jgi:iron complex outermembrane receptor protein